MSRAWSRAEVSELIRQAVDAYANRAGGIDETAKAMALSIMYGRMEESKPQTWVRCCLVGGCKEKNYFTGTPPAICKHCGKALPKVAA